MHTPIDPTAFVDQVRPHLRANDHAALLGLLRARWSPGQIAALLADPDPDARKVAALSLGLIGSTREVDGLCRRLADADPVVRQMAEHALWSIWFRSGSTPAANADLCRGARALAARRFDLAVTHFDAALDADPQFAEAYNQRAIAHYLRDDYAASVADCRRAVELMPCHFGAWAGLGHCYLHTGHSREALRAYRRALAVHPHMDGVRQTAVEICRRLRQRPALDGPGDN